MERDGTRTGRRDDCRLRLLFFFSFIISWIFSDTTHGKDGTSMNALAFVNSRDVWRCGCFILQQPQPYRWRVYSFRYFLVSNGGGGHLILGCFVGDGRRGSASLRAASEVFGCDLTRLVMYAPTVAYHERNNQNQVWCVGIGGFMFFASIVGSDYNISPPPP